MYEIREIPFMEGLFATSDGRILDSEYNEIHKWIDGGYYYIYYNGKNWHIHRVIAIVFIENPENKECVHHINHNKLDNRVENLMWLTNKEHIALHMKCSEKHPMYGKHHSEEAKKKIKDGQYKKPVWQIENGEKIKLWESAREAGRNGFSSHNICSCCLGKRKTCGGFEWEFA